MHLRLKPDHGTTGAISLNMLRREALSAGKAMVRFRPDFSRSPHEPGNISNADGPISTKLGPISTNLDELGPTSVEPHSTTVGESCAECCLFSADVRPTRPNLDNLGRDGLNSVQVLSHLFRPWRDLVGRCADLISKSQECGHVGLATRGLIARNSTNICLLFFAPRSAAPSSSRACSHLCVYTL